MKKKRLDEMVVEQGLAEDVIKARSLIMAGEIRTGDRVWEKAGEKISIETDLHLKNQVCKWVSRGGLKLERGLDAFSVSPEGLRCLDIGASTGGFTHVLLENKASEVVAVDVGYGLLASRLRKDPRVVVKERTNFRNLTRGDLGDDFALIVTDVSFISLDIILPVAAEMLETDGKIIALIKPQFEAAKGMVPAGGVIKDPDTHKQVISQLAKSLLQKADLNLTKIEPVPLVSHKKNIEFISLWQLNSDLLSFEEIEKIVNNAHQR
jgi:23S rRNA (cytidine1920-2'-O)/16S rRNA (cytidine1409-2'-O)-methyltransferase